MGKRRAKILKAPRLVDTSFGVFTFCFHHNNTYKPNQLFGEMADSLVKVSYFCSNPYVGKVGQTPDAGSRGRTKSKIVLPSLDDTLPEWLRANSLPSSVEPSAREFIGENGTKVVLIHFQFNYNRDELARAEVNSDFPYRRIVVARHMPSSRDFPRELGSRISDRGYYPPDEAARYLISQQGLVRRFLER